MLVWDYSLLSLNPARVSKLRMRLEAMGVELVSVTGRQPAAQ